MNYIVSQPEDHVNLVSLGSDSGISQAQYVAAVPVPGPGEVQRFGDCLPHLAAVKVERVSVSVRRQLPTAAAHAAALDGLPALLGHGARLKVVLDGAGQVAAGEGAVVSCLERTERKNLMKKEKKIRSNGVFLFLSFPAIAIYQVFLKLKCEYLPRCSYPKKKVI